MNTALIKLRSFTDSLIRNTGVQTRDGVYELDVDKLDKDEQAEFAALLLDNNHFDSFDFFQDDRPLRNDDITSSLLNLLKKDTKESREQFIEDLIDNVIYQNKAIMQSYIDERCIEVTNEDKWDSGFCQVQNGTTGEWSWQR
jgi:hypothetical protein